MTRHEEEAIRNREKEKGFFAPFSFSPFFPTSLAPNLRRTHSLRQGSSCCTARLDCFRYTRSCINILLVFPAYFTLVTLTIISFPFLIAWVLTIFTSHNLLIACYLLIFCSLSYSTKNKTLILGDFTNAKIKEGGNIHPLSFLRS